MLPSREGNAGKSLTEQFTMKIDLTQLSMTKNWTRWKASWKNYREHPRWFFMSSTMIGNESVPVLVICQFSGLETAQSRWKRLLTDSMPGESLFSWDIQRVWGMVLTSKGRAITSSGLAFLGILSFMIKLL